MHMTFKHLTALILAGALALSACGKAEDEDNNGTGEVMEMTTPVAITAPGEVEAGAMMTLSGEAEPGATVEVYVNGDKVGEATAGEDGTWSIDIGQDLTEGEHTVEAKVHDDAGNEVSSDAVTVTVTPAEPVEMGPMCAEGEDACGEDCVDLATDIDNCGECGRRCGRGTACVDAECVCFQANRTWCGAGECVDTQNDTKHCGECGNVCPAAHYCDQGECIDGGFIGEVVQLTNEARKTGRDCGGTWKDAAGPLSVNDHLAVAAQRHAEDMAERMFFAHDNPDGETPTDRMRDAGYTGSITGENIARGQTSPAQVVQGWIDSPGHCRNLMSASFTEIGVGYYRGGPLGHQWVQNFGAP